MGSTMGDTALPDVVVIAVMGMTGAGKSTFIQKASGLKDVVIGHGLASCTSDSIHLVKESNRHDRY